MKGASPKEVRVTWEIVAGEGGNWIGRCDELSLSIQAETREELLVDIIDVPRVMFNDLATEGQLKRFLRERGLSPVTSETTHFDLPVSIPSPEEFDSRIRRINVKRDTGIPR